MATRCTIKIHGPDRLITLYRHWDGYAAGTGRHLADVLRGQIGGTAQELADKLLAETYEQQSWEKAPRSVYELTKSEEYHGDTEYRYRIWLFEGETPGFQVLHRDLRTDHWSAEIGGGQAAYRDYIAQSVRTMRYRQRQLAKRIA